MVLDICHKCPDPYLCGCYGRLHATSAGNKNITKLLSDVEMLSFFQDCNLFAYFDLGKFRHWHHLHT